MCCLTNACNRLIMMMIGIHNFLFSFQPHRPSAGEVHQRVTGGHYCTHTHAIVHPIVTIVHIHTQLYTTRGVLSNSGWGRKVWSGTSNLNAQYTPYGNGARFSAHSFGCLSTYVVYTYVHPHTYAYLPIRPHSLVLSPDDQATTVT